MYNFGTMQTCGCTTEYTEWQWPLSSVHSIMRVKSAHLEREGDASTPPFTISFISYKAVVYSPTEWAGTLPLFLLYPYMDSVGCSTDNESRREPTQQGVLPYLAGGEWWRRAVPPAMSYCTTALARCSFAASFWNSQLLLLLVISKCTQQKIDITDITNQFQATFAQGGRGVVVKICCRGECEENPFTSRIPSQ